jgi:hypothetical protein
MEYPTVEDKRASRAEEDNRERVRARDELAEETDKLQPEENHKRQLALQLRRREWVFNLRERLAAGDSGAVGGTLEWDRVLKQDRVGLNRTAEHVGMVGGLSDACPVQRCALLVEYKRDKGILFYFQHKK